MGTGLIGSGIGRGKNIRPARLVSAATPELGLRDCRIASWGSVMKFALSAIALLFVAHPAWEAIAQPYCAMYENGTRACGIPTLESCTQSLEGVGGTCELDQTQAIPPNFFQRQFEQSNRATQERLHPRAPSQDQPGGLDWMPPPPQESQ